MEQPRRALFLCTGNSARSQMAEAIVNARLGTEWRAQSAGTRPVGYVHPLAIRALGEIGIEHRGASKSVDEMRGIPFDLVVTVCDSAAEDCPLWLGPGRRVHLGYPDPGNAPGDDEARLEAFRRVRDDMIRQLPAVLRLPPNPGGARPS
jgi:arsenate reductase